MVLDKAEGGRPVENLTGRQTRPVVMPDFSEDALWICSKLRK